jgi:hypothetical protein
MMMIIVDIDILVSVSRSQVHRDLVRSQCTWFEGVLSIDPSTSSLEMSDAFIYRRFDSATVACDELKQLKVVFDSSERKKQRNKEERTEENRRQQKRRERDIKEIKRH